MEITTNTRKSETKAKDSYVKPARLLNLINRFLQYKKDLDEISKRINAGGGVTTTTSRSSIRKKAKEVKTEEDKLQDEKDKLQDRKDNIDAEKTKMLNGAIFPAMANLTVLLEQMREHPYIRDVFEDDVKELFLQASSEKPGWPIFHRFVEACVCRLERGKLVKDSIVAKALTPDFRAILGEYMQRAVYEMMKEMMSLKFEDESIREKIIQEDMVRPIVWSKFFAADGRLNLDPSLKPDKQGMPRGKHSRPASF